MWNFSHLIYWYLWLWEEFLWGSLWRINDNCKTNRSWVSGNSAQLGWKLIQIFPLHNQREEFPIFRQRHFPIKTLPSLVSDKKLCPQLSARNMVVYLSLGQGSPWSFLFPFQYLLFVCLFVNVVGRYQNKLQGCWDWPSSV